MITDSRHDEIKNKAQEIYEGAKSDFEKGRNEETVIGADNDALENIEKRIKEAYGSMKDSEEQALFIDELRSAALEDSLSKSGITAAINKGILFAEKNEALHDSAWHADALVNAYIQGGAIDEVFGAMSSLSLKEKEQAIRLAAECIPQGKDRVEFSNKTKEYMLRQYMRAAIELSKSGKPQKDINKDFAGIIANVPLDRRGEFMANLSCRMSDGHYAQEKFQIISKAVEKFNETQRDHLTGVFNLRDNEGRGDAARMHIQEMASIFDDPKLSDDEAIKRFDAMVDGMDPNLMQAEINFIEAELTDKGQEKLAAAIDNHNKAFSTCYEGRGVLCDREKAEKFFESSWVSVMAKCKADAQVYQEWAGKNPNASKFYKALEFLEKAGNATRLFFTNRLMVQGRPQSLIDTIDRSFSHSNFGPVEEEKAKKEAAEEAAKEEEKKEAEEETKSTASEIDEEAKTYWETHPDEKKEFSDDIYSVLKESVNDIAVELAGSMKEGKDREKAIEEYRNVIKAISNIPGIGEKQELYDIFADKVAKNLGLDDKKEIQNIKALINIDATRAMMSDVSAPSVGKWIRNIGGKEHDSDEEEKEEVRQAEGLRKKSGIMLRADPKTLDKDKKEKAHGISDILKAKQIADKVAAITSMKKRSHIDTMTAVAKWAKGNEKEAGILRTYLENGGSVSDKCGISADEMKTSINVGLDPTCQNIKGEITMLATKSAQNEEQVIAEEDPSEEIVEWVDEER